MTEATTRYAHSHDGTSIAYRVHGEGPLDLVLVPGFVSHVELLWEEPAIGRFLRRLASFSRLVVFDKRGQGLSDRPGRPPTLEESMDDLAAVMDAAGIERAAILGISLHTVDLHLKEACRRLGVRSRVQAVAEAQRLGLLALSTS